MRKYPFIALLLFAFICMMASPNMPFFKKKKKINSNNVQKDEEKDEEWGDEYDYI